MADVPGTLNWPTSLDTTVSLVQTTNGATTTLTAGYTTAAATLTVADNSLFPTTGSLTIGTIGLILRYTGKSSTTGFTGVTWAADEPNNPTDTNVVNGSQANQWVTARHHNVLADGIIALEAKVGIGADTPVSGDFLKGTGTGSSAWSALTAGDVTTALTYTPLNTALSVTLGASPSPLASLYANVGNGTGVTAYQPFLLTGTIYATDLAAPSSIAWEGLVSQCTMGYGGAAVVGTVQTNTTDIHVDGCGNAANEYTPLYVNLQGDIGTGFTQTGGPSGRFWLADMKLAGSIAVQPNLFQGISVLMANHYNGNPANGPSAGLLIQTKAGTLGASQHIAATTYPIQAGIAIMGVSTGGTLNGFTTALQIGGSGGGWSVASSLFGTGIDARDYVDYGIHLHDRAAGATGPALQIDTGAGRVVWGEGINWELGTSTGTKIGTGTNQLLAFYGSTPIAQRASANQAAAPSGGTGATAGAYDTSAHRDAMIALVNEMRTVLVNLGLMKGSA